MATYEPSDIGFIRYLEDNLTVGKHALYIEYGQRVEIPVIAIVVYLLFVFGVGPAITSTFVSAESLKDRDSTYSMALRLMVSFWNVLLAVFSACGAFRLLPLLFGTLQEHGLFYTICHNPYEWYLNPKEGRAFWTFVFIFSKIPELLDTVFMVLRGKQPILLHWYHHVTVLLYCWHSLYVITATGLWFSAMNFLVHAVMYTYYAIVMVPPAALGPLSSTLEKSLVPFLKKKAVFITRLQILQMVFGILISLGSAVQHLKDPSTCFADFHNYTAGLLMYASYFLLFLQLLRQKVRKKPADSEANKDKVA